MKNNEKETTKNTDVIPTSSTDRLISSDEFDNLLDDFFSQRWPHLSGRNFPAGLERGFPKVDIVDHNNEVEVHAALPGVKKEDVDVSVNNHTITIRATIKEDKKEEGKYFRREIIRGEFQRTLTLPENVESDNAKASFKDGILKVTIPKTEKNKRKNIEIK